MTIWERTQTALVSLGVTAAANKLIVGSGEELPDEYLVYQLIGGNPDFWADNKEKKRTMRMQVNYWSRNGLVNMPDIEGAMKGAGFTAGAQTELPFYEETGHYGLSQDFFYSESEN
jgi:hypothetical protein